MSIVKTKSEIKKIEKSCLLSDKTFDYILKEIKQGISEKELVTTIRSFFKKHNAEISFRPIAAFGKNTAHVHHKPTEKKLKKGDIIMLDFGSKVDGYCSDMTRTIFFGKANDKQKKMYETVLTAQQKAIKFLSSANKSVKASQVDKVARSYIESQGYPTIPHSLGHGLGTKVHEYFRLSPKSKTDLKPCMVFSIEPGIYLPGFGGVRIEDLVVLEKNGPRILTHSPKELIEL